MLQQINSPVCRTAIVMAAKRAIENKRDDRLFDDPFAAILAGDDAIQQQIDYHKTLDPRNQLKMQFVAIRTRYFDDFILNVLPTTTQIVILGSGFDTRAYRLSLPPFATIYEIDLPEIITYKSSLLAPHYPKCNYHAIASDVTSHKWCQLLLARGYQSNVPTIWVMEGLLMYLSESNVYQLLGEIQSLSTSGSHIIADLVSVKSWEAGATNNDGVISGHWKSGCDEPETLFANYGWNVTVQQPGDIRANYGRYTVELPPRSVEGRRRSYLVTGKN